MQQEQFTKIINERYETLDVKSLKNSTPVSVVHRMANKPGATTADIEICAMITAMFCWDHDPQKTIETATGFMDMANWDIAEYVKYGDFYDIPDNKVFSRMLKAESIKPVLHNLRQIYSTRKSMKETIDNTLTSSMYGDGKAFKVLLYDLTKIYAPARMGSPERNSACSRINNLLRWMVRSNDIDLGVWQTSTIQPSMLKAILDCKVATMVATSNFIDNSPCSWKAVEELTYKMKMVDQEDPLKCDVVLRSMNSLWIK